jgi:hypothetical protein
VLQKISARAWIVLGIVAVAVAVALVAEHGFRCWRSPLTREEAVARGQVRLDRFSKTFNVKEPLTLTEATLESEKNTWLLTYTGLRCKVIIMVDRCNGDDVGSVNACGG